MKFSEKLQKAIGSGVFWYQSVVYFAIIVLQLAYPDLNWIQMVVAAVVFQAILLIVIASGFETDAQVTSKKK